MSSDNLSSDISLAHDPYERALKEEKYTKHLVSFDSSSKFAKKWNRFKGKLEGARDNMIQGGIMGLMVGGLFGFAIGCYSAIQTRRFMAIPISTIVSGVSFGFILGCGSMIRAAEVTPNISQLQEGDWLQVLSFNNRSQLNH
jgi:hypothetical protein